jgi:hypothetical protein
LTLTTGKFLLSATVTLLAGLVYLNSLHNPFVYDDYHTVEVNPSIQSVTNIRAIVMYDVKRPIVNFSYAVDRAVWGAQPFGFHVTNVMLHMANVGLLFLLASQLTGSLRAAGAAAALFAVHPMMTEAVGYISGRSEVLCAMLLLGALLCGRRAIRGGGAAWTASTAALWIASVATKEIGVMFPFAFLAYDWSVAEGAGADRQRRLTTIYLPLIVVTVLVGAVRLAVLVWVEHPGAIRVHWSYLPLALDAIGRYVGLMAYPRGQTIFHSMSAVGPFAGRTLLAAGIIAMLSLVAWFGRQRHAVVTFGILWFLLMLMPSALLTVLDQGEPMAEHRVYAASVGLWLACGSAVDWLWGAASQAGRRVQVAAAVAFGAVILSLSLETILRNAVWSDPIALWRESADLAPQHFRPRLLLGEALMDAGRIDEAAAEFKTAIRLRPDEPTGHVKLGGYLATTGQLDEARSQFHEALRLDPENASALQALAILDKMTSQSMSPR